MSDTAKSPQETNSWELQDQICKRIEIILARCKMQNQMMDATGNDRGRKYDHLGDLEMKLEQLLKDAEALDLSWCEN
jgi:hypothetical protein